MTSANTCKYIGFDACIFLLTAHYFPLFYFKKFASLSVFGRNFSDCTEISAKKLLDLASGKQNLNMGKKLSK